MEGIFYNVIRQFFKGETETHSMEVKADRDTAVQRFFNILAADLADAAITYNSAFVIDSNGVMIEGRVFDRRPTPEPEPEQ